MKVRSFVNVRSGEFSFDIQSPFRVLALHGSGVDLDLSTIQMELIGTTKAGQKTVMPKVSIRTAMEMNAHGFGLYELINDGKTLFKGGVTIAEEGNVDLTNEFYMHVDLDLVVYADVADATVYVHAIQDSKLAPYQARYMQKYIAAAETEKTFAVGVADVCFLPKAGLQEVRVMYKTGRMNVYLPVELDILNNERNEVVSINYDADSSADLVKGGSDKLWSVDVTEADQIELTTDSNAYSFILVDNRLND